VTQKSKSLCETVSQNYQEGNGAEVKTQWIDEIGGGNK